MSERHRRPSGARWQVVVAAATVLVVAVAAAVTLPGRLAETRRLVAHFDRVVGLYVGSDVRILGVRIGSVTAITPMGDDVRVEMSYLARYAIPADAHAMLIPPSLVSDRYVQLAPAFGDGPSLPDGAELSLDRTSAPLETDEVYRALSDFTAALGPSGANASGAFSGLLRTGREALEGNGANLQATLDGLSKVASALADNRDDLFTTLVHLQEFTTMLAQSDQQLRSLNQRLAEVAGVLAADRDVLTAMLRDLANALAEVTTFIQDNREALKSNVEALTEVTGIVARQQRALVDIFDTAPLTLSNLILAYNQQTANLDSRILLVPPSGGQQAPVTPAVGAPGDPTLGGILRGGS